MSESRPREVGCQGTERRRRSLTTPGGAPGRGTPEKVTTSRSDLAMAGPIPRTRCSPSMEPNAPNESRLATIRCASAGPMRGSDSIAATVARSRSSGPVAVGGWWLAAGGWWLVVGGWWLDDDAAGRSRTRALALSPFFFRLSSRLGELATAESTRAIWAASSPGEPAMTASPPRAARHALTPIPSAATAAKKTSAWRSAGVGMPAYSWLIALCTSSIPCLRLPITAYHGVTEHTEAARRTNSRGLGRKTRPRGFPSKSFFREAPRTP